MWVLVPKDAARTGNEWIGSSNRTSNVRGVQNQMTRNASVITW
jgi:hypothetical protein